MKNILITGVSSGLGRAIAQVGLGNGHRIIGTVRDESKLKEFENLDPQLAIGKLLDVTDTPSIRPLIASLEAEYGSIDVVINNAGYGLRGALEELDLQALREQFDTNLFGAIAVIQAVLPGMRNRRAGHILNIGSMGSVVTYPLLAAYHGTKFALLGMSDALRQEVAHLNIFVTVVLPGTYSTDWSGRSLMQAEHHIADYDPLLKPGLQLKGDPMALGKVVIEALGMDRPPEHLVIGPVALKAIRNRLGEWNHEITQWEELSQADGEG